MTARWLERASNQSAAAETDAILVSGDAGRKIMVHWIFFSTTSAGTVMLESGANRIWEMYPDANGGAVLVGDPDMVLFETNDGEDLTYTFNVADNHFIAVGFTRRST